MPNPLRDLLLETDLPTYPHLSESGTLREVLLRPMSEAHWKAPDGKNWSWSSKTVKCDGEISTKAALNAARRKAGLKDVFQEAPAPAPAPAPAADTGKASPQTQPFSPAPTVEVREKFRTMLDSIYDENGEIDVDQMEEILPPASDVLDEIEGVRWNKSYPNRKTWRKALASESAVKAGIKTHEDRVEFMSQIGFFTHGGDSFIRSKPRLSRDLSRKITAMIPTELGWDRGSLARGITVPASEAEKYLEIGHKHGQLGISSWSSDVGHARGFAEGSFVKQQVNREQLEPEERKLKEKPVSVLFIEASTPKKRAVSISAVSQFDGDETEFECLYPDNIRFRVKKSHVACHAYGPVVIVEVEEVPEVAFEYEDEHVHHVEWTPKEGDKGYQSRYAEEDPLASLYPDYENDERHRPGLYEDD